MKILNFQIMESWIRVSVNNRVISKKTLLKGNDEVAIFIIGDEG